MKYLFDCPGLFIFLSFSVEAPEIPFRHLGEPLHHGPITGLAMCAWKPIFMTCGKVDRTVRIWNYETESLEMIKQYDEDVFSVALHPTGLFAAIGFEEKLRFMIVLLNDIQTCREFPIRECKLTAFSSHGHYFAVANESAIQIYSCISFQNVWNLKGQTGKVRNDSENYFLELFLSDLINCRFTASCGHLTIRKWCLAVLLGLFTNGMWSKAKNWARC